MTEPDGGLRDDLENILHRFELLYGEYLNKSGSDSKSSFREGVQDQLSPPEF